MGGYVIKTISLHEEKFRELVKQYKNGDLSAVEELVEIFSTHIYKNINRTRTDVSYDIVKALVEDLVVKDLVRDRYVRPIYHYSNNYLARVKLTIDNWSIDKSTSLTDIQERLIARKIKTISNDQWQYDKALAIVKNRGNISDVIDILYSMSYDNLTNYIKNYNDWTTLNQEDKFDAIEMVIINKIYKYYDKQTFPEEYYNWIVKLKRSLQCLLDRQEKSNIITNTNGEEVVKVCSIQEVQDSLIYDGDPLIDVIKQENSEILQKYLHKLKDRTRKVLELKYFSKTTYSEIAKIFNVSNRRIQQIEKEGLEQLRNLMRRYKSINEFNEI